MEMDQMETKEKQQDRLSNVLMRARDAWVRALSMWVITTLHVSAIWEVNFVVFYLVRYRSWQKEGVSEQKILGIKINIIGPYRITVSCRSRPPYRRMGTILGFEIEALGNKWWAFLCHVTFHSLQGSYNNNRYLFKCFRDSESSAIPPQRNKIVTPPPTTKISP